MQRAVFIIQTGRPIRCTSTFLTSSIPRYKYTTKYKCVKISTICRGLSFAPKQKCHSRQDKPIVVYIISNNQLRLFPLRYASVIEPPSASIQARPRSSALSATLFPERERSLRVMGFSVERPAG